MRSAIIAGVVIAAGSASGQMRITEWAYSVDGGEFVEFTNVGGAPIDLTGWVYDDNSRISIPGPGDATTGLDLSAFGVVAPGQSVVITEATEAAFRTNWGLAASIGVIGGYTNNLGRADEINLFDSAANLVDRLTYDDQNIPGSPRTQDFSGNPISAAALGANDSTQWTLSFVGDAYGSYTALTGEVGKPGSYIPAPASAALMGLAGLVAGRRKR